MCVFVGSIAAFLGGVLLRGGGPPRFVSQWGIFFSSQSFRKTVSLGFSIRAAQLSIITKFGVIQLFELRLDAIYTDCYFMWWLQHD